jgi:hypothetical protein
MGTVERYWVHELASQLFGATLDDIAESCFSVFGGTIQGSISKVLSLCLISEQLSHFYGQVISVATLESKTSLGFLN